MSDQLLVVLRVCLLALVYLVFLRVVRAVYVELRADQGFAAAGADSRPQRRRARVGGSGPTRDSSRPVEAGGATPPPAALGARLVVVAPSSLAGQTYPLAQETTIGRASGCGVAIDDTHVSKLHARVYHREGAWLIEDLGSTNGTTVDGAVVVGPTLLGLGSRIRIGDVELELA